MFALLTKKSEFVSIVMQCIAIDSVEKLHIQTLNLLKGLLNGIDKISVPKGLNAHLERAVRLIR